jgi:hypothetical protein
MSETPQRSSSSWPLAIAAVAIALIALIAFVFKSCAGQSNEIASAIQGATQPQYNINTVIQTSLERLREESKLVVFTADVAVMVTKFSEKKVLYGKVDLGTTTVRVRAAGNKAQLIVPLNELSSGDFEFDENLRRLTVTMPPPRVDKALVEVQTDPTFYEIETEPGWARLDSFSGDFLRDQARRDLRPAVIAEASHPRIIKMAEESGREKLQALLAAAIAPIDPKLQVVVEFKKTERP